MPLHTAPRRVLALVIGWALLAASSSGHAQDDGTLLEVRFTPASRVQLAIWIEDDQGQLLRTLLLTESVAYRGIGNRPGASQMNSGYRWPYGRREGVLPIWGTRRAAAPNAKPFKRVIYQLRPEGNASRITHDESTDYHFCLSHMRENSGRDALDAVSCASVFSSDKGRFIQEADLARGYAEPFEQPAGAGAMVPLDQHSLYPPRMDVEPCTAADCYDHEDIATYAEHVRDVMPEIDAITSATLPADIEQSLLFSLPRDWPRGDYALWIEVSAEGDYNASYGPDRYPTPQTPDEQWDSWALTFGYPYRGQPSVAFTVPLTLGERGQTTHTATAPAGQSSWHAWDDDFGALQPLENITDDPAGAPGSGADRLRSIAGAPRITVIAEVFGPDDPAGDGDGDGDAGQGGDGDGDGDGEGGASGGSAGDGAGGAGAGGGGGGIDPGVTQPGDEGGGIDGGVGAVHGLRLSPHEDPLRSHTWVQLGFFAASSEHPVHRYEVRISEQPITDLQSFLRGRPAKEATDAKDGPFALILRTDAAADEWIEGTIGDLSAETTYYVAVRAVNRRNQPGPIATGSIRTTERTFATVTPCFIATAAYGTELAPQVSALRRARDRYLMSHALGRALVAQYYAWSPALAERVRATPWLASLIRALLDPAAAVPR